MDQYKLTHMDSKKSEANRTHLKKESAFILKKVEKPKEESPVPTPPPNATERVVFRCMCGIWTHNPSKICLFCMHGME